MLKKIKKFLKLTPVLGPIAFRLKKCFYPQQNYVFSRELVERSMTRRERTLRKVSNLLNFTKTNKQAYSADIFSSGYHSIEVLEHQFQGQRDPLERIEAIPFDFNGKSILDLGCNQGGMLHAISEKLECGIGIDYDYRMINAANRIAKVNGTDNLAFFVFDLDKDPLELIEDFLPETEIYAVFFLAVAMWIERWKEVIIYSKKISNRMVFESNGSNEQQEAQVEFLKTQYDKVEQISGDPSKSYVERWRTLFYCH